jgi:hypothetical protein
VGEVDLLALDESTDVAHDPVEDLTLGVDGVTHRDGVGQTELHRDARGEHRLLLDPADQDHWDAAAAHARVVALLHE